MVQSFNFSGILNTFRVLCNPSLAMPHLIVDDIRQINFTNLKKYGNIKAIGFDKDNCLTAPYASDIHPSLKGAWQNCLTAFTKDKIIIVSNSAGTNDDTDYKEASNVEKSLGVSVLRHKDKKPAGGHSLYQHFRPIEPHQTAFVGDRILTDVVFGNRNGNLTIWTSKIITERGDNKAALVLRRMEHYLIRFLQQMNVKPPPHPAVNNTEAAAVLNVYTNRNKD
ncbi:mitochondrial PGP phosphatase-domain-containing protein [Mycotypha africana]|uniref:mitochondrial PGP phosphatase-domain-containing protein n=1 Tax=Mycotypha africana TaxID=64632 RepID=UPI002300554B|nr:mitochondrial PGP phosphatase-domain-containing protein [Mycotypha africana]KAI8977621.1 mitochondrial PGP phosphatase-domain-containing protein [Mycotypha africana]